MMIPCRFVFLVVVLQERIVLDARAQTVNLDGRLGVSSRAAAGTGATHPIVAFFPRLTLGTRLGLLGFLPSLCTRGYATDPAGVVAVYSSRALRKTV